MRKILLMLFVISSLVKGGEIYCFYPSTCDNITVLLDGEVKRMRADFIVSASCNDRNRNYSYKGRYRYFAKNTKDFHPKVITAKFPKKKIICYKKWPGFPGRFSFNLNISKHYIVFQVR